MNKKELERLKRKKADRQSRARSGSEDRQARIKVLWQELQKKETPDSIRDQARSPLGETLTELVPLQKDEIEYLTQFRRLVERVHEHCPNELQDLIGRAGHAEFLTLVKTGTVKLPEPTYEWKRTIVPKIGEIEREFGSASSLSFLPSLCLDGIFVPFLPPRCLDGIFAGGSVNMLRLQELFGMKRNRFPKKLPPSGEKGRETLYDYRAVSKIMDALLSEKPSKRKTRGRPLRTWLSDPDVRTRVLTGIQARMNSLSMPEPIKAELLAVVRPHLPDSDKK